MEYKKFGERLYIRVDKGEEIIAAVLSVCRKEGIRSATFSGIGGCRDAEIQTFLPEEGRFETERAEGMLELVSIMGNVMNDGEGGLYPHAHGLFAFKKNGEHRVIAGHIKSSTVLYTAELELRPVFGGEIRRKHDAETGTGFWDLRG
ncbi:MAG: PPC domain-containing DNA-binding protein [Bacillota bacterium]|jgi:predicted DNA-binding protein with PD1-like motif